MNKCLQCGEDCNNKYCSNKCQISYQKTHNPPKNKIALSFYGINSIEELSKDFLKSIHFEDLDKITKILIRNELTNICEEYREFRKTTKLCKNCNEFYKSSKRSGSKCPNEECKSYNKDRWSGGVEKNKESKLKNWGDENYNNYEKQVQTMLDKYRCKSPLQMSKSREKRRLTTLGRYGVEYPLQSDEIKEKIKQANVLKYGVEHPSKLPEVIEKMKETMVDRYGVPSNNYINVNNYENFNADYIKNNFLVDGVLNESMVKNYFNFKTLNPILKMLDDAGVKYKREPKGTRKQRDFFAEYLKESGATIEYEKTIHKKFRVDGFIEPNIIVEFLGDYWHGKQNDSTLNKKVGKTFAKLHEDTFSRFKKLKELGYEIQYIWESDFSKQGLKALQKYE